MSGIDEQDGDVTPCGCRGFEFWTIRCDRFTTMGYLNPDAFIETHPTTSVNKWTETKDLSKRDFVMKITNFHCSGCRRMVEKGCDLFEELCRDVMTRWNV